MDTHDTTPRLDLETLAAEMFPAEYAAIDDDHPMDPVALALVHQELARRQLAAQPQPAAFTDMADLSRWQPGQDHTEPAEDDERHVHIWLHLPPGATVTIQLGDPEPVTAEPAWSEPDAGQALARMLASNRNPHLESAIEELTRLGCEFLAPRHGANSTSPLTAYVRFRHPSGRAAGYLYPTYFEFRRAADVEALAALPAARRTGLTRVAFTHEAGLAAVRWLIERHTS